VYRALRYVPRKKHVIPGVRNGKPAVPKVESESKYQEKGEPEAEEEEEEEEEFFNHMSGDATGLPSLARKSP